MEFREVAETFAKIEKISAKLEITALLAELYRKTTPEEARKLTYLLQGILLPPYYGVDLGVGEKLLMEAIARATGHSREEVEKVYKELGDEGKTAEFFLERKKQTALLTIPLTLSRVYETLFKVATAEGEGSVERKIRYLVELFNNATPLEGRYIARITVKKLRLGIGDPTIMDALSWAKVGGKEYRELIERAYNLCSDLGYVAELFLKDPSSLKDFKVQLFRPLRPALAERLRSAEEIFARLGVCGVEYKYDGFRQQVHKKGDKVAIFSRKLERMEHMFPDLVESIKKLPVEEIIFEGEALAYNEKKGRFFSFQETMHRRRKYGIEEASKEYPLHLYVFDVMYIEGEDLTTKPFKERRKRLEGIFPFAHNLKKSHFEVAHSAEDIKAVFEEAISKGLEGIMAKDLKAPYTAGKRGFQWIKLKKSYLGEVDTIDAVAVGWFKGKGARAAFGFGGFLVAVYNEEEDRFETIAKVSSGFTEEELKTFAEWVKKETVPEPPRNVLYKLQPDHYLQPSLVIEVAYDEITLSPQHTCCIKELNGRGLALRFPRFLRVREDKEPYEATTTKEVLELFRLQRSAKG